MFWPTIQIAQIRSRVWVKIEPKLGGDDDLVTDRPKRFAHQCLVREGAINFGSVEESDAPFDGCTDKGDHLLLVCRRTKAVTHAHAAKSKSRDLQIAVSKFTFLHIAYSFRI